MDVNQKGRISQTDLQVAIRRSTCQLATQSELELIWLRMNRDTRDYIDYDTFMFELLPKTKKKTTKDKIGQHRKSLTLKL